MKFVVSGDDVSSAAATCELSFCAITGHKQLQPVHRDQCFDEPLRYSSKTFSLRHGIKPTIALYYVSSTCLSTCRPRIVVAAAAAALVVATSAAEEKSARRAMDALVSRARRIGPLRSLSDPLLLALFANSDCIPDRVQQGVVRARRAMDALVSRARRIGPLRSLSDPLLLALFANSDCIPDRVQQGVVRESRAISVRPPATARSVVVLVSMLGQLVPNN
ncbi:hypothetical protein ANCCEY_08733 [Ancylostoma ceylanicum]|uniref:Uncharacterized protein n=1 Tax=Ancylostoma ceylanicum TaxID=53326 RepID=A0A0D6LJC7_9BILA|nr:hypothetical protein ANCCEY_08733 [Ancylostoma ceylanicum]